MIGEVTRAVIRKQSTSPKTVLGFFAILLAIVATATVPVVAILASQKELRYLIPIVLGVVFGAFLLLMLVVLAIVVFGDPTRLMLGEMTGSEYSEHQRMVLGDNVSGVRPAINSPLGIPQVASEGKDQGALTEGKAT
jgi:hypothetical protein